MYRLGMRSSCCALVMLLSCLGAGPLGAAEIETEYDGKTDFSKYRTYSWGQKPDSGKLDADTRIVEAIESQLKARGWALLEQGKADAVLAAHAIVKENQGVDTAYTGWGPGWSWSGPGLGAGAAITIRTEHRVGTLVVDIFDAGTRKLVWRGTASDTLATDSETNRRKLDQAASRLFRKFPPARKAVGAGD